jgi:hypothetical protein
MRPANDRNPDHRPDFGLKAILIAHSQRYPHWQVEDLYKLIHQAAMGSEHAAPEETRARLWLFNEIRDLGEGPEEPLVDPISPDGALVRVHLRPFMRANLEVEKLLAAFLDTARGIHGSVARLESYARVAVQLAGEGGLPFGAVELESFIEQMKERAFPAIHHSPAFAAEYRPAYRVAARQFLPEGVRR